MRRIFIPILAILLGLLFAASILYRDRPASGGSPNEPSDPIAEPRPQKHNLAEPPALTGPINAALPLPEPTAPIAEPMPPPAEFDQLHIISSGKKAVDTLIGSDTANGPFKLKIGLVRWGAGIKSITLADFAREADQSDRYALVQPLSASAGRQATTAYSVYPFASRWIQINGHRLDLQAVAWEASNPVTDASSSAATYQLTIGDSSGEPVLRIERCYILATNSYDLRLLQSLINLTNLPLQVVWSQNIQGDIIDDGPAYLGDRREFVTGYFAPWDPARLAVRTGGGVVNRVGMIKTFLTDEQNARPPSGIWPLPSVDGQSRLVWLASANRYFTVVTCPVVSAGTPTDQVLPLQDTFTNINTIVFPNLSAMPESDPKLRAVVLTLGPTEMTVPPGQTHRLDHGIFAGPRQRKVFATPPFDVLQLDALIRYELGCTWFTFQWLARFLLNFLETIHSIVKDWGIAIVILVVVVRLILHPLTKKAQVNMMIMGKQMQSLQPEMDKLRKKFKDDQSRLNQEMMKLYREKGVNPFNMLGCLPMFLQMPIWVALYAMLYYAIELRHQPAFYGVFQAISSLFGGSWSFLGSLSDPDRFIQIFSDPKPVNLFLITLDFQYLNILPPLMAVVFFFQQKFTTPPATTDQARQQQMMMKFMVLLFPIFLYSAPSGLTLYILASTGAGVVDSYLVRKHVRQQEDSGTLFKKKPRKPGGFMDRLSQTMEQKQRELQQRKQPGRSGGSTNRKKPRNAR